MLRVCSQWFFHKQDGLKKKQSYFEIHLKSKALWLKLEHNWVFHQNEDPESTSELVVEYIKQVDNKPL